MGKHIAHSLRPAASARRSSQRVSTRPGGAAPTRPLSLERHVRSPWSLPVFSSIAVVSLALVSISDTSAPATAIETMAPSFPIVGQEFTATAAHSIGASVASYEIVEPPPEPEPEPAPAPASEARSFSAPAAGPPDPGSAKAIAADMVAARGWGSGEFDCLVALWNKESGWNVYATNPSSGAYGIPQSLPGNKMATAGSDWQTNPATQITWGLGYIEGRYGTPCGAWAYSQSVGWY
ncbi:lytic transglycosylase domain-containing protein [Microcella alkalica]|uniref:Lytic transglycosylase domain-containing protein n=1 Tax=Microcella alkalica TaxID=355930 RepID=A0A839E4K9_9MICO|nr:hypothetical protein [Microcella alkalica]